MKEVITKDGSITFFNDAHQEHYHSVSGAREEAIKKFVEPCNIKGLTKKETISILDVCFGLGYNSAAAIDTIKSIDPGCRIMIRALESDQDILDKTQSLTPEFRNYNLIQTLAREHIVKDDLDDFKLLLGNALETIKAVSKSFDAVFFDPFSPKKAPELWSQEFFRDIYKLMNNNSILATYSCARMVRTNLKAVGFTVKDGPIVGRRAPSTIALKTF